MDTSAPGSYHYTCLLREATVGRNIIIDGFILEAFIHKRHALIKVNGVQNVGVLCGITRDTYPTEQGFYVSRVNILSGNRIPFSRMLNTLGLPEEEHGKLVTGLCDLATNMVSCEINNPPKLLSITIDIGKWSVVNIPSNNLAQVHDSGESSSNNDDECSICFEPLSSGPEAVELSCKHKYHLHCVIQWMSVNSNCPICLFKMPGVPLF